MDVKIRNLRVLLSFFLVCPSFWGCTPKQDEVDITPPKSTDTGTSTDPSRDRGLPGGSGADPFSYHGGDRSLSGTVTIEVSVTLSGASKPVTASDLTAPSIICTPSSVSWSPAIQVSSAGDKATATFTGKMPAGSLSCSKINVTAFGTQNVSGTLSINQSVTFDASLAAKVADSTTISLGQSGGGITPPAGGGGITPPAGGGGITPDNGKKITASALAIATKCAAGKQLPGGMVCKSNGTVGGANP